MSKANGDLMAVPRSAVAISTVFGLLSLWLEFWWGAAFFLGMPLILLGLAFAVFKGWMPGPGEQYDRYTRRNKGRIDAANDRARRAHPHYKGPHPKLSPAKKTQARKAIALLAAHGVFQPEVPPPELFFAGLASDGFPVKPDAVFIAFDELDYYHPEADVSRWNANLVLHETQVEQFSDCLTQQIEDLARLSDGTLRIAGIHVEQEELPSDRYVLRNRISYTVNGERVALDYLGAGKYLSTVIHVDLAQRLAALGTGKRLAWLWVDQGAYISLLADGAVEALNAGFKLGPNSACLWEWVDAQTPIAASEGLDGVTA